eukprot:TRINITY_DN3464_c0_g1_i1.p1 TRINITY_DN3464_c0_g1~~TRINITY_DN3464_c0_g1_i1.p1  ORF type:complete len:204 (+),score=26.80 TRINITY_DN3464_c0_g1_i1:504-1115(+)
MKLKLTACVLIVLFINFSFSQLANDRSEGGYGFTFELDDDNITTTSTTSNSSLGTTTSTDATNCPQYSSCSDCVQQFHCVWCDSESTCETGDWYGSNACSSWEWKQCKIAGRYALYATAGVLGLLIIFVIILIACCCRTKKKQTIIRSTSGSAIYRTKNEREEYESLLAGMEKESPYGSYTSSKDRIAAKWGINTSGYKVGHV